jgi:mannose-1-phosphate guanylyltransferase/mannose-6-phosphate isomerase
MAHVQPVILCGGSGTRLWPLSRADFPKQFLSLFGAESLFQLAVLRAGALVGEGIAVAAPLIIGNEEHRFLLLDQMEAIGIAPASILLEPCGRNTAPALTLAALAARGEGADPVLVITPADHMVLDPAAFVAALRAAAAIAETGSIVTLGIHPDRAETGYGYIRAGNDGVVAQFVEKPDRATAERYLREGGYYWNSGIFIVKASVWLAALNTFRPDIATATQAAWNGVTRDAAFLRPHAAAFEAVPAESIDYAVIEKCPGSAFPVHMLPLAAGWSDLGSWDAVWQSATRDNAGNAHVGDAIIHDSKNIFVHASTRLVGVVGVENLVIVETPDAVLVADRARSQDVKKIVAELGTRAREEHAQHRKVHRPWGWYDAIDQGAGFKVKRILVKPGARLSLQTHAHRAEHWVVVSGMAEITCGERVFTLRANESTYIPRGTAHRLTNPSADTPLEIIEVQSGNYLGEDDIVRLEDAYGRTEKTASAS